MWQRPTPLPLCRPLNSRRRRRSPMRRLVRPRCHLAAWACVRALDREPLPHRSGEGGRLRPVLRPASHDLDGLCGGGLGFAFSLKRDVRETRIPMLQIVMLVLLLHGTPAIVYDELRYAWAWKHVGIVDYVQRHGQIDATAPFLAAYRNWPGFFVASAELAALFDIKPIELANIVRFSPPALNLFYVLVLPLIFRRFTTDLRLIWGASGSSRSETGSARTITRRRE